MRHHEETGTGLELQRWPAGVRAHFTRLRRCRCCQTATPALPPVSLLQVFSAPIGGAPLPILLYRPLALSPRPLIKPANALQHPPPAAGRCAKQDLRAGTSWFMAWQVSLSPSPLSSILSCLLLHLLHLHANFDQRFKKTPSTCYTSTPTLISVSKRPESGLQQVHGESRRWRAQTAKTLMVFSLIGLS